MVKQAQEPGYNLMKFALLHIADTPPNGCPPCAIATLERPDDNVLIDSLQQWFGGLDKLSEALEQLNDIDHWVVLHDDHKVSIKTIHPTVRVKCYENRYSVAASAVLSALENHQIDTTWQGWQQFHQAVMSLNATPRHKALACLIAYAVAWSRPQFNLDALVSTSPLPPSYIDEHPKQRWL